MSNNKQRIIFAVFALCVLIIFWIDNRRIRNLENCLLSLQLELTTSDITTERKQK